MTLTFRKIPMTLTLAACVTASPVSTANAGTFTAGGTYTDLIVFACAAATQQCTGSFTPSGYSIEHLLKVVHISCAWSSAGTNVKRVSFQVYGQGSIRMRRWLVASEIDQTAQTLSATVYDPSLPAVIPRDFIPKVEFEFAAPVTMRASCMLAGVTG